MPAGKDKLYISASEWRGMGGYKGDTRASQPAHFRRLPFTACALSMAPWDKPVMTVDAGGRAFIFDFANIVPWVRKHGTHPVTGAPLSTG